MVAESLQRLFDHVYIARNGLEGWDVYLSHQPDIVLTDLNMPFMNGLELSKKIKHHNHDVPILLITAQFEKEITEVAVDIGIDGYLFKPISLIRLEIILNNYKHRISLKRKFRKEHKLLAEYKGAIDASASVTITDAQGFVTYVNNAFCAMSGYTREELIGKPHSIIKHPDTPESVYVDMWNQLSQKKIWKGRLKNLHKDGSIYFESLVIIPIIDEKKSDIGICFSAPRYYRSLPSRATPQAVHTRPSREKHVSTPASRRGEASRSKVFHTRQDGCRNHPRDKYATHIHQRQLGDDVSRYPRVTKRY
jgi:PAS domain S-box-containing protein